MSKPKSEYALLRCGLVIGPVIQISNRLAVDIKSIQWIKILLEGMYQPYDAADLNWNLDGTCVSNWMTSGRLDIVERFNIEKLDSDGKKS